MDILELKDINLTYHSLKGETQTLDNISFKVEEGDFLSIVGPSGCGKSSLLNIISGLIPPSSGSILFKGAPIKDISSKIGYMFQKDNLFPWLTVLENVKLGLKIRKSITKEALDRINSLLDFYGLKSFKNYYPHELSGGMRQRVALIRTLALNPDLLILDEPFSALDYQTRLKVCDDIYEIIKQENKTALMVTHDISEAVSTSNKILILSKRPAQIKDILNINFQNENLSPLKRREASEFKDYFNHIWKELDKPND